MKSWSSWFDDVLPALPGCDTGIVTHELRRTAQDFFTRTLAWSVLLDDVQVSAGETEIEIMADDSQQYPVDRKSVV